LFELTQKGGIMTTEDVLNDNELRFVEARVQRVVDGDTVDLVIRCRLAGERQPELNTAEGKAAKKRLQQRLKRGQTVHLRYLGADRYHRLLVRLLDLSQL
jgi:endonuclease YncB( thermonuclease family)